MGFTDGSCFAPKWRSPLRGTLDAEAMFRNMNVRFTHHRAAHKEVAMSNEGKQVARYTALVAGSAVVGAGIGLLFAPQTGTETRREIARYAKKAQIQATRWSRAVQSGVKEVMDRTKRPMVEAV
jgi:YtxH-like protein